MRAARHACSSHRRRTRSSVRRPRAPESAIATSDRERASAHAHGTPGPATASDVWPKPRCVGTRPSSVRWSGPARCKVREWKPELAARSLNRMASLGMPESQRVD